MSALAATMIQAQAAPSPPAPHVPVAFYYTQTDSFVALLHQLQASLLVTTYQANKLLVARAAENGLSTLVRTFDQPMGLAVDGQRMTIGAPKSGRSATLPTSPRASNQRANTMPAIFRDPVT